MPQQGTQSLLARVLTFRKLKVFFLGICIGLRERVLEGKFSKLGPPFSGPQDSTRDPNLKNYRYSADRIKQLRP